MTTSTWKRISSRLRGFGAYLHPALHAASLTIFAFAGVVGAVAFLVLVPQGREILLEFDHKTLLGAGDEAFALPQLAALVISVVALGAAAWYTSRLVLDVSFDRGVTPSPQATRFASWLSIWWPRVLGGVAVLPIAFAYAWTLGQKPPPDGFLDKWLPVVWLLGAQWAMGEIVLNRARLGKGVLRSWVLWTLISLFLVADQQLWHKFLFDFTPIGLRVAWLAAGALVMLLIMMFSRSAQLVRVALMLYAAAALAFLIFAQPDFAVAAVLLLAGNGLLLFIVRRREGFHAGPTSAQLDARTSKRLQGKSWFAVVISLMLSFLLTLLFIWDPTRFGGVLGAPAIVALALASWVIFGSFVVVLFPRSRGWPALTLLPLIVFVLAGPFNDNHAIRGHQILETDERPTPTQHFTDWVRADPLRSAGDVYVVAAAGGGLRAAYWAAAILSELDDASCGRFGRRAFALSGVSGGSLGAAVFVAMLADRGASVRCGPDGRTAEDQQLRPRVSRVLNGDFLSPALASMLFPDGIQRFVPYPYLSRDRAWALETSWEKAWTRAFGNTRFSQPFLALHAGDARLPSLVLNSTVVEDGKRIVASNLKFHPLAGLDLFEDMPTADMALSTAVHNSARFTYVSPAGSLYKGGYLFGRVVDGGYFENSGAASLRELIATLAPDQQSRIHSIILTNDATDIRWCNRARPGLIPRIEPALSELSAPLEALLDTREARGSLSELELIRMMGAGPPECSRRISEFALGDAPSDVAAGIPVLQSPLGWFLSGESQHHIEAIAAAYARAQPLGK